MDGPCWNCPDRQVGCHSTCPHYIAWREKKDEQNALIQAERESRRIGGSISSGHMNMAKKG